MLRNDERPDTSRRVGRVLILADGSAEWRIAGLRQLDRLFLSLCEFSQTTAERLTVSVLWSGDTALERQWLPEESRSTDLEIASAASVRDEQDEQFDLILSTRLFLYRNSLPQLIAAMLPLPERAAAPAQSWNCYEATFLNALSGATAADAAQPWRYLGDKRDVSACEGAFLRDSGKSQDGLVSRHINRPFSRMISRLLLKLPLAPNTWSVLIFALPLWACLEFLSGTGRGFFVGCAIYQLYSILDGCDGEIARARFLQTDFGRRLDSLLDLVGNMLLAFSLGIGLARQWDRAHASGWFYVAEGLIAAMFIALSEGIVFARRSRAVSPAPAGKWNGALYQRHHEFLERSGILVLGERFAWWLVQLTKRDMAMLAFLVLAAVGCAEGILHLLVAVSGVSAFLAGNAFRRQPAPALPQEAS
ncbi:MAG: CDP-alcohol phosphatidyltransferase family protein [Chthoniobacterales bacterium]|nr:CDP-alcohol phosphatidyltransferase family protein [Chthoniobacterales bacterium]